MAIDMDDEILQDFLVEAGEILDALGEQLVELEQSPNDLELLKAIFRGFHTVKGGAGFLSIDPLVEVCHSAEDVFNVLRQGERKVTPDLMDVILRVLDVVNEMFCLIRQGKAPDPAGEQLLERLKSYTKPESSDYTRVALVSEPVIEEDSQRNAIEKNVNIVLETEESLAEADNFSTSDSDDITEQEFEQLLDALHGKGGSPSNLPEKSFATEKSAEDEITAAEFEKVLDELHGKGKFAADKLNIQTAVSTENSSSEITDSEFEQYLDELHGKGKFDIAKLPDPSEISIPAQPSPSKLQDDKPVKQNTLVSANTEKVSSKLSVGDELPPFENSTEKTTKSPSVAQTDTTVRVDTQVLDDIMNMVGELVLVRNRFQTLKTHSESNEQLTKAISNLDVVTADLQLAVMKTRMQPIKKVFGRFPRVVRDLARSLKKEIRLELIGEETDLDKNLVEALADPLVHLIRNAVDHGIESPADREAKGKPREGVVILKASQEGDHIQLSIKDDGKGMNPEQLRARVVQNGLMDEETASRLDEKECYNLIFLPGFSTKTEISDVSGRGVGMDVVKTRISQMNGVVEIDSKEGIGSTIIIKVPLTLAIMPTLMVKLGGQAFALPLASVLEILDLDLTKTNKVDGQLVAMVRNKALPLFYLSQWLVKDPYYQFNKNAGHVVVVNAGGRQVGFVVDQLIGQEEVVIKALGAKLHGLEGLSGATITGDGKIALILDVPGLMKKYAN